MAQEGDTYACIAKREAARLKRELRAGVGGLHLRLEVHHARAAKDRGGRRPTGLLSQARGLGFSKLPNGRRAAGRAARFSGAGELGGSQPGGQSAKPRADQTRPRC